MRRYDHFVYVFGLEGASPKKIGYSNDPEVRLRQVQTGNPFKVFIERTFPFEESEAARRFEIACHRRFASKRMNGEWFDISVQDVIEYRPIHDQEIEDERREWEEYRADPFASFRASYEDHAVIRRHGSQEVKDERLLEVREKLRSFTGLADRYHLQREGLIPFNR